jgi:pyruvate dehydrogenase (quinone)
MAESIGVRGIKLEDPGDVESGIAEALAHDGLVVIDAAVRRMVLPFPPSITAEIRKGFR